MFPRSRALAAAFAATLALLMSMVTAGAHAEMPKPVLELTQRSNPTQLAPGGEGTYEITVQNLGSASTTGTLTVTDELPPGVTAKYAGDGGFVWQCGSVGGQSTVTCTSNILDLTTFGPDIRPHEVAFRPLAIGVEVDAGAGGAVQNRVSVSGGGAAEDVSVRSTAIGPSSPGFGIADFSGWLVDLDGRAAHQAGSHPDFTTDIDLRTTAEPGTGFPMLPGNARYVEVDLPPGLVGNPTATPACTTAELANAEGPLCRPETQVGTFDLSTAIHIPALGQQWETPVFNVDPGRNAPARFGFNVAGVVVYIEPNVRTGGDYGVSARVKNISQTLASVDSKLTFWGVPAASAHDSRRGSPFGPDIPSHEAPSPLLTMPTSCSGSPLRVAMSTASWEHPDVWDSASFETDFDGNPILNDGCDRLPFDPGLSVEPQPAARAGGPAGLRIELTVPQSESASGLSSAHLKKAVIT
ncbi:MAG TPA: hypothetical protein VHA54_08585, partial [Solirubrobacterales bacterium]|nr:hypothetical protein [Solirubrobacterales bacterium]